MDGLARAFLKQPVVFLQYDTDSIHAVHRIDRFYAAWELEKREGDAAPETPYTMVDSGRLITDGERDYQREYRGMVETELLRPPSALMWAQRTMPSPSSLDIKVQVTNISTTTLETAANGATLHAVLFEGTKVLQTGNKIHATRQFAFDPPLAPGDTREFSFSFTDVRGVRFVQAEVVAMVDYLPPWALGRWDMMQAVVAEEAALPPVPTPWPTVTATPAPTLEPTVTPRPTDPPTITPVPTAPPPDLRVFMPYAARSALIAR